MKHFIVYNDFHVFSPHELEFDPYPDFEKKFDIILIGDIVDLYNCKYKNLPEAKGLMKSLQLQFGSRYVSGNHELTFDHITHIEQLGDKNILFTHGDIFYSTPERFKQFRSTEPGAGTLRRLGATLWNKLRHLKTEKISDEALDRAIKLAQEKNCQMIVTGHQHPLHILFKQYKGITIVCLPQGRHLLKISEKYFQTDLLGEDYIVWGQDEA